MYEKDIEKAVCTYARDCGMLTYKFVSPATAGVPDRIFFIPGGKMFMIEFKRPGGELSSIQERHMKRFHAMGFDVYVIDDIIKGKAVIDQHLR